MSGDYLGCGDGGCVIEKPRGMHTNGRCLCLRGMEQDKRTKLLRAIARDRARIAQFEQQLAAASGPGIAKAPSVQRVPAMEARPETGTMQFGADWPGVFVRGDNAMYYARCIAGVLRGDADVIELAVVRDLQDLMGSCHEGGGL